MAELLDVGPLVLQHANALLNELLLLIHDTPDLLCRLAVEVHDGLQLLTVEHLHVLHDVGKVVLLRGGDSASVVHELHHRLQERVFMQRHICCTSLQNTNHPKAATAWRKRLGVMGRLQV